MSAWEFVDPLDKRIDCEEDYVSPPYALPPSDEYYYAAVPDAPVDIIPDPFVFQIEVLSPPEAPSLLTYDFGTFELVWNGNNLSGTSYRIETRTAGSVGPWAEFGSSSVASFEAILAPGNYEFRVVAYNELGESPPSNPISVWIF